MTEVRSNQSFTIDSQWTLRTGPDLEEEMFSKITIEEAGGGGPRDILILRWRNARQVLSVRDQTFFIGTEQDLSPINWDNKLFR